MLVWLSVNTSEVFLNAQWRTEFFIFSLNDTLQSMIHPSDTEEIYNKTHWKWTEINWSWFRNCLTEKAHRPAWVFYTPVCLIPDLFDSQASSPAWDLEPRSATHRLCLLQWHMHVVTHPAGTHCVSFQCGLMEWSRPCFWFRCCLGSISSSCFFRVQTTQRCWKDVACESKENDES